eukprot:scaffold20056_cov45-Phaeocystis_antarctica.AAC.1
MYWSQAESSKWSLDCVSTQPGPPLYDKGIENSATKDSGSDKVQQKGKKAPHTSSYMSGHHPATVRRAGRKRGARFESCDEQHNIKK